MGRYSIFDAFQAASGAVQGVLNDVDKQLEAQAVIEVQDAELKNREAFHDFLLSVQNSNDWRRYEQDWEDFKVSAYNEGAQGLSSPFAKKLYDSYYKENEMKQRLAVQNLANTKMRQEARVNGIDYCNTVIKSSGFSDLTYTAEDGKEYVKTATEQKKEAITARAALLFEKGILDYSEYTSFLRESYSNLLFHDMVQAGKQAVDKGEGLKKITEIFLAYDEQYALPSGGSVSSREVRDSAQQAVEAYFFKQQKIRHDEGEQQASRIYRKMQKALSEGNWDGAYTAAAEGRKLLQERDDTYGGDGFRANVRDEYAQKFMLQDDVKIAGQYAAYARMKPEENGDYLAYLLKFGEQREDGSRFHPNFGEVVKLVNGEMLQAKIKILGKEKAMQHTYQTLARLTDMISKPPFCNEGVAHTLKEIAPTVKKVLQHRWGKTFDTEEGQAEYLRILGECTAQAHHYLHTTVYTRQTPQGLNDVVMSKLLTVFDTNEVGSYVFNEGKKQARDAGSASQNVDNEGARGVFGEGLTSKETQKGRKHIRNYAFRTIAKIYGMAESSVQDRFRFDNDDSGAVIVYDKQKGVIDSAYTHTETENGDLTFQRFIAEKQADNTYRYTKDEKTADEWARREARPGRKKWYNEGTPFSGTGR